MKKLYMFAVGALAAAGVCAQTLGDQLALDRKMEIAKRCAEAIKLGIREAVCESYVQAPVAAPAVSTKPSKKADGQDRPDVAQASRARPITADDITILLYKNDPATKSAFVELAVNGAIGRLSVGETFMGVKLISLSDIKAVVKATGGEFEVAFRALPPPPAAPAVPGVSPVAGGSAMPAPFPAVFGNGSVPTTGPNTPPLTVSR